MNSFNNNDDKIREKLSQDKFITDSNKNVINNYIPNEKIKPKKISQSQKSFFIFIVIIALLLVAFILYLYESSSSSDLSEDPKEVEDSISLVDKTYNEANGIANNNSISSENTNISNEEPNSLSTDGLDLENFKKFLNSYSYAINRLTNLNNDVIEKNTIYIYIAMKYFDTQSTQMSSLDTTNTQFAKTKDNINKFIYDISGQEITDTLSTYEDYVVYSSFANSYDYGSKSNVLEQYNCTDVQLSGEEDGVYNVIAKVTRTTLDKNIDYEVSINVRLNENFSYVPYQITSIVAQNLSEDFDSTFHLVNLYDLTLDEINLAKENIGIYLNRNRFNNLTDADYTISINSIEAFEDGSYRFNITAYCFGNQNEKLENQYTVTATKEMNNISIKDIV